MKLCACKARWLPILDNLHIYNPYYMIEEYFFFITLHLKYSISDDLR
jgi:hypothetical protein